MVERQLARERAVDKPCRQSTVDGVELRNCEPGGETDICEPTALDLAQDLEGEPASVSLRCRGDGTPLCPQAAAP